MKLCTDMNIDVSGNTTYTGRAFPSPTMPANWTEGLLEGHSSSLSLSDKIALGVGIGFGVPTLLVTVGAWLCARRRGARGKQPTTEGLSQTNQSKPESRAGSISVPAPGRPEPETELGEG